MRSQSSTFFSCLRDYLTIYLPVQKNASEHTIKSYKSTINLLFDFFNTEMGIKTMDINFDLLTFSNISSFMEWLATDRNCKSSTLNLRRTALRGFVNYAAAMDIANISVQAEIFKLPLKKANDKKVVGFLSESALKCLLAQPDTKTAIGIRNLLFMVLMYDTAARNSELLNVQLKNIRQVCGHYTILLHGKGGKERVLPLESRTVEHLNRYMRYFHDSENSNPNDYLFYIRQKGRMNKMSPDCVAKFMKNYGKMALKQCNEIQENIHPHMLRHTRAMHLYRNGMQLPELQQFLGHNQLETVFIYAYADAEMKRKAIENSSLSNLIVPSKDKSNLYSSDGEIRKLCGLR